MSSYDGNTLNIIKPYRIVGQGFHLNADYSHDTLAELQTFAQGSTCEEGTTLYCKENGKLYLVKSDKTVEEVGSSNATVSDDNKLDKLVSPTQDVIVLANADGTIKASSNSLSDFETSISIQSKINNAIDSLKDGVSSDGDTLAKLRNLINGIQTLLNSQDTNLDTLSEIVSYIKNNKSLIDGITISKVNVSDIIDDLLHTDSNKPLSANQGKILKGLLDTLTTAVNNISIPTKISQLTNDSYYIIDSSYIHTDNNYTTQEKDKLTGIAIGATLTSNSTNNGNIKINGVETSVYSHPLTHDSSMITGLSNVATTGNYNDLINKPNIPSNLVGATELTDGLMIASDKIKLDGISTGATLVTSSSINGNVKVNGNETTVYVHPDTHPAIIITTDSTHRFLTDDQISTWNSKVDKVTGKDLSSNDYTTIEKNKLSGIQENAQVNNITDINASNLTSGTDSILHYHSSDRNRSNHTGTQLANTISDFNTAVSSNSDVIANTNVRHSHSNKVVIDNIINTGDGTKYLSDDGTYKMVSSNNGTVTSINNVAPVLGNIEITTANINDTTDKRYVTDSQIIKINSIPTKTSQLINDSGLVSDSNYVHTDNNFSTSEKNKLANLSNFSGVATDVNTITTNFTQNLSSTENTVQKALDKLDKLTVAGLNLGESLTTAYRGDRGKIAYDHSQLTSGNPHGTTKSDIGLSLVQNIDTTNATNITTGTLDDARLSSNITKAGNTFNSANSLLKLDSNGKIPALDGSNLINLPSPSATILQPSGSPFYITQNQEIKITHNAMSNEKLYIEVLEQIPISTITDNTIDFGTQSNYTEQDSVSGTSFSSGVVSLKNTGTLDSYNKLLLHCDGTNGSTTITDTTGLNTVTATGNAKISTTQSKFGGSSAYFDGTNSYFSVPYSANFDFSSGDFTIDFWVFPTSTGNYDLITKANTSSFGMRILISGTSFGYLISSNGTSWDVSGTSGNTFGTVDLNTWTHISMVRSGSSIMFFKNGTLGKTVTYSGGLYVSTDFLLIGRVNYSAPNYFVGYMDEIRISKGIARWTTSFTPPSLPYTNVYPTSPYYLKTNNFIDLLPISKIDSITVTQTTPTNTSIKYLVTFDGGLNYLYHDGTGWHVYIASGNSIPTTAWASSNSYSDLQTYFTNKTISALTSELSSLSITPINIGFAWQLATTDYTVAPSMDLISIAMDTNVHYEIAPICKYGSTNGDYSIRRINSTVTYVKKISGGTANIIPNIIVG